MIIRETTPVCRKQKRCEQCCNPIDVGVMYYRQDYSDGGIQTYRAHVDCNEAAREYANLFSGLYDDFPLLWELGSEDREWLTNKYPSVAKRLWK